MVKVLCYKSEGCWFDPRWRHWNFLIDIKSFRTHYGPGVDSASNRSEYREHFLGVKAAGAQGWQPYHHPVPLSWNLGTLTSWKPLGHSRPVTGLLYLLTYTIVHSPSWVANWFAASQEIPRISRNPKVHYRTHKRPPPVPILGQPNPVHIPTSHLLEIYPNIIHPSTPRSPQRSLSLRFPHQDFARCFP